MGLMMLRDERFKIEGNISLYDIGEEKNYCFEVKLSLLSIDNPEVNPRSVHGVITVDREIMIQNENLSDKFSELPNGVKNKIKAVMREKIDEHIRQSHMFNEISEMNDLISHISSNKNLLKFQYFVQEYSDDASRSMMKKPIHELKFGTRVGQFSVDRVNIVIYRDKVKLHCVAEGALNHESDLKWDNKFTLEQKILKALDAWKSYFTN